MLLSVFGLKKKKLVFTLIGIVGIIRWGFGVVDFLQIIIASITIIIIIITVVITMQCF